jgi:GNAT superfamily N-acetyltransferase
MHHEVMELAARVRAAHADAWAAEGLLREGGAALALRDIRVMASGLPQPQWNGADVVGPDPDLDGARAFYAERGLSLGVRVPAEMPWSAGVHRVTLRLMGLEPAAFTPAAAVPGLEVRVAAPDDLDTVLGLDAAAFGHPAEEARLWLAPRFGASGFTVALASLGAEPAATAYSVDTDGPAVLLAGVAVAEHLRRRGIGAAISTWLLARGFAAGAQLAHLHADTDAAARVYARLGFVDAGALEVFTEV